MAIDIRLYAQVNKTDLVFYDHSPKIFQRNFKYRIRKKKTLTSPYCFGVFLFVSFSLNDSSVYEKDSLLPKSTGLDSMVQL